MPKIEDVLQAMRRYAPPELAEEWDNVGQLVGLEGEVTGILVALDITDEVVSEAVSRGCNLIVSHHPVIFHPVKRLSPEDVTFCMIQAGVGAICMHTNLDTVDGGVNTVLAKLMEMKHPTAFVPYGRIGNVNTTAEQLAKRCVSLLGAAVKYVDAGKPIHRLAVVSGAGGSELQAAIDAGADALLTGEASHHTAVDAAHAGISLIVAGHFATEFPIVQVVAHYLQQEFPEVPVAVSLQGRDPFRYMM